MAGIYVQRISTILTSPSQDWRPLGIIERPNVVLVLLRFLRQRLGQTISVDDSQFLLHNILDRTENAVLWDVTRCSFVIVSSVSLELATSILKEDEGGSFLLEMLVTAD
jgi:hypothetical protein